MHEAFGLSESRMVVFYPHAVDNGRSVSEVDPFVLLDHVLAIFVTKMAVYFRENSLPQNMQENGLAPVSSCRLSDA